MTRRPTVRFQDWRSHVRADALAGATVAAFVVPQCMAYARLAELRPVHGLWAAVPALLVYGLLGTSPRLSVGPDSAVALMVATSVAGLTAAPELRAEVAAALALAVGAVALVAWVVRLGFVADLLSRPVLVGFMTGVAVTMVVSQLPGLTGIDDAGEHRDTLHRLGALVADLDDLRPVALAFGTAVVILLAVLARFRRVPGPLVAVLVATAVASAFDLERHGVATVGDIPRGLPPLGFPELPASMWPGIFLAALGITVVVYSANVLTARAFDDSTGPGVDPNRELLALGGANAAAGLAGGFAVTSSPSRTALAEAAGARTQLTSVIAAGAVLVVLLAAGPLLESFPQAALGALVIYAAYRLVDTKEMRRLAQFRLSELAIALVTFAGVIVFDLLIGIAVAVGLSVLELFARVARAHDAVQGRVPGLAGLHDVDDYPEAETIPGLVVYRYDGPLCFANAADFRHRLLAAVEAESEPPEWVLLNMEANVEIDLTACDMLHDLCEDLEERGITLAMARVKQDLLRFLRRCGIAERVGEDHMYPTLPTALEAFESRRGNRDAVRS
jgi:high affinity sulfate transporter 1